MENVKAWPLGRLLSTSARLLEAQTNRRLIDHNLTRAGMAALEVLDRHGAMTQARLAKTVRVQAQTIGRTLNRLENHGYVVRARSPQDRRAILVDLTSKGKEALRDMETGDQEVTFQTVDVEELRATLLTLIAELEAETGPTAELADASLNNVGTDFGSEAS